MAQLTIEQFELIRRLRNSGIDREELVSAFDQFDEVDRKFGNIRYSSPAPKPQPQPQPVSHNANPNRFSTPKARPQPNQYHPQNSLSNSNHTSKNDHFGSSTLDDETSPPVNNPPPVKAHPPKPTQNVPSEVILPHFSRNGLTISAVSSPSSGFVQKSSGEDGSGNWSTATISKIKKGDDSKSDQEMLSEIRHFIVKNNIKLSVIAEMAGIVPSTVRNYIHGNLSSVSDESKLSIYSWYQASKSNPASLREFLPFKRERFTFRPAHLRILEECYKTDQYPENMKREFLAEECNRAYEDEVGHKIDVRDKVTMALVSNWFNNKRKESKRIVKRVSVTQSGLGMQSESNHGLQFESLSSPPQMEPQDVKPNISEMITSSITTPPSYSSNDENDSYKDSDAFIPMQTIKQEPPDMD